MVDDSGDIIKTGTDVIHKSAGLWTTSDYGSTPGFNSGVFGKIIISRKDKDTLRKLADKVTGLSNRPIEEEKRSCLLYTSPSPRDS